MRARIVAKSIPLIGRRNGSLSQRTIAVRKRRAVLVKHSFPWRTMNHSDRLLVMKKKNLIATNPYLKDPVKRESAIVINVVTSSAIDGVALSAFRELVKKNKKTGKTVITSA